MILNRTILMLCFALTISFLLVSNESVVHAKGEFDIPYKESTSKWEVTLKKADSSTKESGEAKYNIRVKNKTDEKRDVRVELFRSIQNSSEQATMFSGPMTSSLNPGKSTGLSNFPISKNTKTLSVTVYWKEDGRDFKQNFVISK